MTQRDLATRQYFRQNEMCRCNHATWTSPSLPKISVIRCPTLPLGAVPRPDFHGNTVAVAFRCPSTLDNGYTSTSHELTCKLVACHGSLCRIGNLWLPMFVRVTQGRCSDSSSKTTPSQRRRRRQYHYHEAILCDMANPGINTLVRPYTSYQLASGTNLPAEARPARA